MGGLFWKTKNDPPVFICQPGGLEPIPEVRMPLDEALLSSAGRPVSESKFCFFYARAKASRSLSCILSFVVLFLQKNLSFVVLFLQKKLVMPELGIQISLLHFVFCRPVSPEAWFVFCSLFFVVLFLQNLGIGE